MSSVHISAERPFSHKYQSTVGICGFPQAIVSTALMLTDQIQLRLVTLIETGSGRILFSWNEDKRFEYREFDRRSGLFLE